MGVKDETAQKYDNDSELAKSIPSYTNDDKKSRNSSHGGTRRSTMTVQSFPSSDNSSDASPEKERECRSDSEEEQREKVSREDEASCISRWFLMFLTPLLKVGAKQVLTVDDVGVPSKQDIATHAFESVSQAWSQEVARCERKNAQLEAVARVKLSSKDASRICEEDSSTEKLSSRTKKVEPSLSMSMLRAFGIQRVVLAIGLYVIFSLFTFVPVLLLNDLVKYFEAGGSTEFYKGYAHPWVEVVGLGIVPIFSSLFQTRHSFIMTHFAVFVRSGCSSLLYRKSLQMSATGRAKTSTGQVVNMMSNDTNQMMRFMQFAGMSLVSPIQIVVSLALIYSQVGNAMWVGVLYMVILVPVNFRIFGLAGSMRREVLKYSDSRVKVMNEILSGIRIIKFYAWEKPFGQEVGRLREQELKALTRLSYVTQIGFSVILMSAPIIQIMLVFLTFIYTQDEPLTASVAFTTVALFQIMRFPFAILPMGFLQYIQSKIAIRRIASYLQLPELDNSIVINAPHPDYQEANKDAQLGSITMKQCSFGWVDPDANINPLDGEKVNAKNKSLFGSAHKRKSIFFKRTNGSKNIRNADAVAQADEDPTTKSDGIVLREVSCRVEAGSLVAVVGEVGSGKSSLLSAILGEMEAIDGSKVYIPREVSGGSESNFKAYCSQTPWVVNDSVRGNILFGRTFDQERYDKVLAAAALKDDLFVLPAGDMTEIGERGINLSGGQKARVSLARALYSKDTRVLLLDDPLSAVDAHVGEHIFNEAIAGQICSGMTRVLVTHHVHFLPRCDSVIVMNDGRITHQGRYLDLLEQGVDFSGAIEVTKRGSEEEEVKTESEDGLGDDGHEKSQDDKDSLGSDSSREDGDAKSENEKGKNDMKKKGETLISEEEREEGSVAGSAYYHYAKFGGLMSACAILASQCMVRGFEIGSTFWLAKWADDSVTSIHGGDPLTDRQTTFYLQIYVLLGILSIISLAVRGLTMAAHRLRASRRLHNDLTKSILRAPVDFFDVTPTGRVINRFAYDMDKVDLEVTNSLGQGLSTIFNVIGAIGAIIAATKGAFLVPLIPIGWLYYIIQRWFRRSSTELQRVTSMTMSPIFADFSQTLTGTQTVRAYGEEERFFKNCLSSFDKNNASYVLVQFAGLWLGLRLDVIGGFVGAFIGGLAVATASSNFIPAGWLGLALSFSNEITNYLKHGVRMIATLEADLTSVERILQYAEKIDHEAPDVVPSRDPAEGSWPTTGEITFQNASMRYRDGPLVLNEISFHIRGGEKIGVVGRTGSGKSSVMIALFRISELEKDGGKILIDDIDTCEIGTSTLRSNLSIIPQEPMLFSNTVKYNLDPFGTKTEEESWAALKKVRLSDAIVTLPGGLNEQVTEGGENFSQGQRQLLCIARSLLRSPRILVMDEATASIDNSTDAAVQEMIRENFSNATVLTIAHRLNTIMDSDRILVLDGGRVAEFDSPEALLTKNDGIFAGMVEKSRRSHS